MKALVVGAGMYVTGRGATGHGTVLAAIAEYSKTEPVELIVFSRQSHSRKHVEEAIQRINGMLGTRLQCKCYAEEEIPFDELLATQSVDLAIVSVPDALHFKFCKATLGKRVATLVVKPLTPTTKEAIELIQLAEKNKTHAVVEFHKRWDESNLQAKATIEQKLLGSLSYIDVNYSQRITIPSKVFKGWVEETNIFQYLGVHYVDLVHFITGYYPSRVMAHGQLGVLASMGIQTFDSVHAAILWKNRETGHQFYSHFNTNWIDPESTSAMSDQKMKIVGTKGRMELDQKNRGIERVTAERGIEQLNPYFAEYLQSPDGAHYFNGYGAKSIMTFLKDVHRLKEGATTVESLSLSRPGFRSSLVSTAVIEIVNDSLARNSEWLSCDDRLWLTK